MKWFKHLFKGYDKYLLTIPDGFKGIDGTHVRKGYVSSYKFVGYNAMSINNPDHQPFTAEPVTVNLSQYAAVIKSPCEGVSARQFAKYIARCCNKHCDFKVKIKGFE